MREVKDFFWKVEGISREKEGDRGSSSTLCTFTFVVSLQFTEFDCSLKFGSLVYFPSRMRYSWLVILLL